MPKGSSSGGKGGGGSGSASKGERDLQFGDMPENEESDEDDKMPVTDPRLNSSCTYASVLGNIAAVNCRPRLITVWPRISSSSTTAKCQRPTWRSRGSA